MTMALHTLVVIKWWPSIPHLILRRQSRGHAERSLANPAVAPIGYNRIF